MKVNNRALLGKYNCVILFKIISIYYSRLKKYEIMMVLNQGQYYSVSLCKEKSSIQLDIILEQNVQSYGESREQLIDFFQIMLRRTCQEYIPASTTPVAYAPCPYCNELHIKYKSILEKRPQLCNMKSIPLNYYQDLLKDTQGNFECLNSYVMIVIMCLLTGVSATEQLDGKLICRCTELCRIKLCI